VRKLSYSQIAAYARCPRAWRDAPKGESTIPMEIGNGSHEWLPAHVLGLPAPVFSEGPKREGAELAENFSAEFEFPVRESIISVEGTGIPKQHAEVLYGKTMGSVALSSAIGLRGVMDLVYVEGEDLVLLDWKTGQQDEEAHALQGACYAILCAVLWPGFPRYIFRPVYLRAPYGDHRLVYGAEDIPVVRAGILAICEEMLADADCPPKANRYCGNCPLRGDCSAYTEAITVEPETMPVTKLPMSRLAEEDARARALEKILGDYREEIRQERLSRLDGGPVVEGGEEWYLAEKTTRYDVPAGLAAELLAADEVAEKITPDEMAAVFSVSRPAVLKLKTKVPETVATIEAASVRRTCQTVKHRPASGIIDHVPAADRESPPILSAAAGALPITVGAPDPEGAVVGSIPPAETSEDGAPLPIHAVGFGASAPGPAVPLSPPAPGCAAPDITHTVDEPGQVAGDPITDAAPAVVAQSAVPQSVADSSPAPGRAPRKPRRPRPVHSCGMPCRWERPGADTAWCPKCSAVFYPVAVPAATAEGGIE